MKFMLSVGANSILNSIKMRKNSSSVTNGYPLSEENPTKSYASPLVKTDKEGQLPSQSS